MFTNFGSKILVVAAVGATLAGCDSIKDVRDTPSTPLPPQMLVLEGHATNVGSKRPVVLAITRDGSPAGTLGVLAPPPAETNEALEGVTPFTFGTFAEGTQYNVTVFASPAGKSCSVVSGGTGTLQEGVPTNVEVVCNNVGTRYDVTVNLDPTFAASEGAQVVLTTEDAIYRITPQSAAPVVFEDVLFNATGLGQAFTWNLIASNTVGGTLNKCPVTVASGSNSASNVTSSVGACSFTIGGTVAYSPAVAGGPAVGTPDGLVLELRDIGENTVRTQAYSGAWGGSFTFNEGVTPVQFVSNRAAVYTVAVAQHPDDMHCVVNTPAAILYAPTLTSNPTNIAQGVSPTAPQVFCRQKPAPNRQLRGVYRHVTTIWKRTPASTAIESTWNALDFSKQNTASSNMIAFFENGTFIYGTHANTVQIEHGFYNYDPDNAQLTFTLNADTNTSTSFPSNFRPDNAGSPGAVGTTLPGMSALPGSVLTSGIRSVRMSNVNTATAGRISGTFSGAQTIATTAGTPPVTTTSSEPNAEISWVLQAPPSIANQMTGAWLAQDSRRLWVFDKETYYGTHVGVVGIYTMNDACFTMPDVSQSSGLYTRRPSINGCYPWPRAGTGQTPTYLLSGFVESVDTKVPQFAGSGAGQVDIGTLPDYMARIPGGAQAVDGRSPSPMVFHIAPADDFYTEAPAEYFPTAPTTWCNTEILGIRATLNAVPIHKPVYFCRFVP